jgi:hypothetical protein
MCRGGLVEIAESADMSNESAIAKNECTIFLNESATARNQSVRKYVPDSFFGAGFVMFADGFVFCHGGFIYMSWRPRWK